MVSTNSYIETMKRVAKIFNENNIKYALSGGVVAELRSGVIKAHKDVDFSILERDIPKIEEVLQQNGIYTRTQMVSIEEGENWADTTGHNKTAKDINTGVDVGFFVYGNQEDEYDETGELVSEGGFVRKTQIQYKGKSITLRERMDAQLENYLFSQCRYEELEGIKINVQPLPYIMMLKAKNMRGKDRVDLVNTIELLTDEEIEEYNKLKNSISNIHCTAQMGKSAKEGKCDEVKKVIDISAKAKGIEEI